MLFRSYEASAYWTANAIAEGKLIDVMVAHEESQDVLTQIVLSTPVWAVRKAAFSKLDGASLGQVAAAAQDPAISIAASVKLKQTSWSAGLKLTELTQGPSHVHLLAAISLYPDQPPEVEAIRTALKGYFGDKTYRIGIQNPRGRELRALVEQFGDRELVDLCLNLGDVQLRQGAETWASDHGYVIRERSDPKPK